ncbi:hypothetical protein FXO37_17213 [Capsicum annuum]|nr:hypothetical protein FXO37_17213 [Capsicum annuum]
MFCLMGSQKLKEAERERINNLEEFERKANVQLERQLVLASEWSRKLLSMQGKLKGTEWDPEHSHRIDYSEFQNLLNANNVQFMEYSNYGQTVSVILPYYKDGKANRSGGDTKKEIVFKRHIVDRMPIDSWNDVWRKLHQQLVNVDVYNANTIPAEVYSTVATAVVWSMRLALSVLLYIWIDNKMRPIYSKLIPCDLGSPPKKIREPLKQRALGSLGKSRFVFVTVRLEIMYVLNQIGFTGLGKDVGHLLLHCWCVSTLEIVMGNSGMVWSTMDDVCHYESNVCPAVIVAEGGKGIRLGTAKFISAEEKTGITFDDFAGQEYIKRELQEIVRILRNEEEFQDKGIYCPKGVLLHGPPGTGKTLLAKAIAGEAGLPFFAANGTDFVEVRSTCNLQPSSTLKWKSKFQQLQDY